MRRLLWMGLLAWWTAMVASAASLRVSALHPLMADLARQVGGDRVEVFDLVGEGGNPHHFEPRPDDMKRMQSSALVLAAGKGLESHLDRLRAALAGVEVVEVGSTIPSLAADAEALCPDCEDHEHHTVDPHWWQGVDHMRRAARVVAQALAAKDPGGKETYLANAASYGRRLDALKKWAKGELAKVPAGQRKLVTAHHAFGYFAKEFGFEVVAVAGLNDEQNTTPQEQAKTIEEVRKSGVQAVFPELNSGTKSLEAITRATGTNLAEPLISDGNGRGADAGFEAMIRHNVNSITRALGTP